MAEEEIIIRYKVDVTGIKQAGVAVDNVTDKIGDMGAASKAAFASKELDNVVEKLYEQGDVMGALIQRYGDAGKALKAVNKELNTMAVLGQGGTKEFKELSKAAAELTDTIDDTRGAVKKLASDTRTLDLMAQGVRAVTAGFAVAAGAAALFGKENEDLQKAILKVQAALALMQGAQELANIATEKGGIASKAYGLALQAVDKIQKALAISSTAAWGLIGIAIAGAAALLSSFLFRSQSAKSETLTGLAKIRDEIDKQNKVDEENAKKGKQIYEEEKQAAISLEEGKLAAAIASGQGIAKATEDLSNARILYAKRDFEEFKKNAGFSLDAYRTVSAKQIELDKFIAEQRDIIRKAYFEEERRQYNEQFKKLDDLQKYHLKDKQVSFEVTSLDLKPEQLTIDTTKLPEVTIPITIAPLGADLAAQKFITEFADTLSQIAPTVNAFADLGRSIFAAETQALETEKNKQLAIAGDNAQKREKIEKDFAIKRAKLARQQAIADKAFATFNAVVGLAQAISKTIADNGFPAAIPFIALAAATGAAQIAAIAASPLPEIPQFAEGGAVPLIGGKIRPDGAIIGRSHRSGGVLIEAEGGEFINNTVSASKYADELRAANEMRLENLIMHKYVAPAIEEERRKARAAIQHISVNNEFDDALLRKTVRDSARENAVYVANKVAETVSDSIYFKQRYK